MFYVTMCLKLILMKLDLWQDGTRGSEAILPLETSQNMKWDKYTILLHPILLRALPLAQRNLCVKNSQKLSHQNPGPQWMSINQGPKQSHIWATSVLICLSQKLQLQICISRVVTLQPEFRMK